MAVSVTFVTLVVFYQFYEKIASDRDEENLAKNIEWSNFYEVSPKYSDNPLVGILLCTDKSSQMVEDALSGMDNQFLFLYICAIDK